jgi:putative ABC transport system permease protein
MRTPFALLNMLEQWGKTLIGAAGVAFAVLLVFMQLGFEASARIASTSMLSKLDYDIALVSSDYLNIYLSGAFPLDRLEEARGHPDVIRADPLRFSWNTWYVLADPEAPVWKHNLNTIIRWLRGPSLQEPGLRRTIFVLGFNPSASVFIREKVFAHEDADAAVHQLYRDQTALMDTQTRAYFGPRKPGTRTELGPATIEIVGECTMGTGYGADGLIMVSEQTFSNLYGSAALGQVSLGLIKLRPEVRGTAEQIKQEMIRRLGLGRPGDEVLVLTRAELEEREQSYWMQKTPVGLVFRMGVFVAWVVGIIFVYQVISSDVATRFHEFATLKAMGYSEAYLTWVVLQQALVLAVLGFLPALGLAWGLYALGREQAQVPMQMTAERIAGVFLLSLIMCSLSGFLSLRKVRSADPAELF